jgi:hypothetical protein
MAIGRADRIAIDPTRANFGSPTSLDGVIERHHEWPAGNKCSKQDTEEDETGMPAVPSGTVEDTMILLKVALFAQSHSAQSAAHGALSW